MFSLKSLPKHTRFWVTQRSVRYMTSMVRMLSRREWVAEVVAMTLLTSSNPSLVATPLVVRFQDMFRVWNAIVVWTSNISHELIYLSLPGGGSSRGRRQRRGEDVIHPLKVSLEDLCNGTSKKLSLSRNVICSKCKGWVDISFTLMYYVYYFYLLVILLICEAGCGDMGLKS